MRTRKITISPANKIDSRIRPSGTFRVVSSLLNLSPSSALAPPRHSAELLLHDAGRCAGGVGDHGLS